MTVDLILQKSDLYLPQFRGSKSLARCSPDTPPCCNVRVCVCVCVCVCVGMYVCV